MGVLGVAVIGLGTMGRIHANNLMGATPGAQLVAVADPVAERRAPYEARGIAGYGDYRECIAADAVDVIVVASSSTTHAEVVAACLLRRLPIFCEKPLALIWADALTVHQSVEASGVPFQLGFMRRYDPAYQRAWALIEAGEIGTPYHFSGVSRDQHAPKMEVVRHSGGLFLDTAVHDFDLARWLLKTELRSVYARGGLYVSSDYEDIGDIDQAHASFEGENGSMGLVELTRNAIYGYDVRTEVLGTKGAIQVAPISRTAAVLLVNGKVQRDTFPGYPERFYEAYAAEMTDFVRRVGSGLPVSTTSADGIRAMAAGLAAEKSRHTGRPEVIEVVTSTHDEVGTQT